MKKNTALLLGALIWSSLSAMPAEARSVTCARVNEAQIAALFDRWNGSLATHDPDKVATNYAPDAVLLPTVSNTPRTTPAGIREYFVHFLEAHPQGKIDTRTIRIGCNTASDVGTYSFTLAGKEPGTTRVVKARYSFIYTRKNKRWLISHHHSSAMPEPAH